MDKLLARLSEQQAVLNQQNEALKAREDDIMHHRVSDHASSSNSLPVTPATDAFPTTAPTTRPASATLDDTRPDQDEVLRLKLQLARAQTQISKLDTELAQTRTIKPEPERQAFGLQRGSGLALRDNTWAAQEDAQSDTSDAMSAGAFNRARGIWGGTKAPYTNTTVQPPMAEPSAASWAGRHCNQGYMDHSSVYPSADSYRGDRLTPDSDMLVRPPLGRRGNRFDSRLNTPQPFNNGFGGYPAPVGQYEPMPGPMPPGPVNHPPQGLGPVGMGMYSQYQQVPMGTPLSPHASEFTSKAPWKNEVSTDGQRCCHGWLNDIFIGHVRGTNLPPSYRTSQLPTSP